MLLIIIVTLVSVLIFVAYKIWGVQKIKTEWLNTTIEALIVFLFMPLCFYFITSYVQDLRNAEENKKNELFQKTLLDTVYSNNANTQQLDELIRLKHQEIFLSSTEDAKKFASKLLADLELKKKGFMELSNSSSELVNRLYLKWKPFFDFVLLAFDDRIDQLSKQDDRIQYSKNGNNPIVYDVDEKKYTRTSLRGLNIEGKTLFHIVYDPGEVREGLCIKNLTVIIYEREYQAFKFHFSEDGITLDPDYKKYSGLGFHSKIDDPLTDEKLREKTIEAINLLISSSYIRRG